jgi:MraZ protein
MKVGGRAWVARLSCIKYELELMFLGEFTHAIDDKGRLTIPSKVREALEAGAVITRGYDKHILVYTADDFKRLNALTATLSLTDPINRALLRQVFSGATEVAPDKQGRILIPPFLREYAGIELGNECAIVGVGLYLEIWNKAGWQEQLKSVNDSELNAKRFAARDFAPGAEKPGE